MAQERLRLSPVNAHSIMSNRKLSLFVVVSFLIHLALLSFLVIWTRGWFEKKRLGEGVASGPILFVNVGAKAGEGKDGEEKGEDEEKKETVKKNAPQKIVPMAKNPLGKKVEVVQKKETKEPSTEGENTGPEKIEETPGGTGGRAGADARREGDGGTGEGEKGGSNILSEIRRRIEKAKHYPSLARMRQVEGVVALSFRIEENGSVSGLSLVKSSGSPLLDDEAQATVRRATPLPYYPETIRISLRFSLESP